MLPLRLRLICLMGLCLGPVVAQQSKVEISLSAKVPSTLQPKGAILLRPVEGDGEPVRLEVASWMDLSLTLPPGSNWEASGEIPEFWVPRKVLTVDPQSTKLTLDLWPMGKISGTVKVKDKTVPLPKKLTVKTLALPAFLNRPAVPAGAMDCPVDEKGAWTCSLPAATFDLVISAQGLTPLYRWGVPVAAGKTAAIGTVLLERGASVVGWVAVEGGQIDSAQCTARLVTLQSSGASLKIATDVDRTAVQGSVRKDGFFQMTGLAPGTYTLEIQQPGYSAARVSPVRIDPAAETFLREPLVLRRPLELELEIQPPLDWLGQPWKARLTRLGEQRISPVVFEGPANQEGRLTVPGQSPGRFDITIEDSLGNALYSNEELVDGPSTPLRIQIELVTVEGRIRLGSEPLAAVLWFGGKHGEVSAKMESDAEGSFHGVLPREGMWRLEVEASQPGFPAWTRADVQAGDSGKATLQVDLPDTRVFGRVVDEQGMPVPGADVFARSETSDLLLTADAMGAFEFRGVPEGPVWLAAESASQVSDRAFTVLVEGNAAGPIELRLRRMKRLTGTVLSPRGPVVGSQVTILARTPDGGGAVATTDTTGSFETELSQATSRIAAVVSAPGFALRAFEATVGEKALSFEVTEEGGDLEIRLPVTDDEGLRENLALAVFQNGLPVPTSVLGRWAHDHGRSRDLDGALRIPELAPGEYRACLIPREMEILLPWSAAPQGGGCDSGFLSPGSTLTLKPGRPE